jgi:actin, other eukaryote
LTLCSLIHIKVPEALFKPSLIGLSVKPLHEAIVECISRCDPAFRADLLKNVVLAGGNTNLRGFRERIRKELSLAFPSATMEVLMAPGLHPCWVGAAPLSEAEGLFVLREDYDEAGPDIINRKCIF